VSTLCLIPSYLDTLVAFYQLWLAAPQAGKPQHERDAFRLSWCLCPWPEGLKERDF
jgi:hypothetical protein